MSDFTDWSQNRRIRDLASELSEVSAAQQRTNWRLRSELSKATGSIEQRLDRLTAAFDAFVEINDLRVSLAVFEEHATVRLRARQVLAGMRPGEVPDVSGYWLAPAVTALLCQLRGDDPTYWLEQARCLDRRSSAVFHALSAARFGHGDTVATPVLTEALGEVGETVTVLDRTLWTLAADGHYGVAGAALVRGRLADFVGTLDKKTADGEAIAWCRAVRPDPVLGGAELPNQHGGDFSFAAVIDAADRLPVLKDWLDEALRPVEVDRTDVDPVVDALLAALVEQGSPEEAPLLARERELRRVIENGAKPKDALDSAAGRTLALIKSDVEDDKHPGRRQLAIRVSAPHIVAAAEKLAAQARAPIPDELRVHTSRGNITVDQSGRPHESVDRAARNAAMVHQPRAELRRGAIIAAVVAVGFAALGVIGGLFCFVLAAAAAATAGAVWLHERKQRAIAVERGNAAKVDLVAESQRQSALFEAADQRVRALRPALAGQVAEVKAVLA